MYFSTLLLPTILLQLTSSLPIGSKPIILKRSTGVSSDILGYTISSSNPVKTRDEGIQILNKSWNLLNVDGVLLDKSACQPSTFAPAVWSLAVYLQALVDGEKRSNGTYKASITQIFNQMAQYYNPTLKCYSSGPGGSTDCYYDDNAQIASALVTAFETTLNFTYLRRGQDVVSFLMDGWNYTTGGVTWQYANPYVATISTTETALACLRLYEHVPKADYLSFARKSMDFIKNTLADNATGLIFDGLTGSDVSRNEFSYHVGTAISACVKLYKTTGNDTWKSWAKSLTETALDRNLVIFDRTWKKEIRFWKDGINFSQLLFEGLRDYYYTIERNSTVLNEIGREARMIYDFARADIDSLYYPGVESPLSNDAKIYEKWKTISGTTQASKIDYTQFCSNNTNSIPVRQLLVEASAARIFLLTSDIYPLI